MRGPERKWFSSVSFKAWKGRGKDRGASVGWSVSADAMLQARSSRQIEESRVTCEVWIYIKYGLAVSE